jgi:hypothetical protein
MGMGNAPTTGAVFRVLADNSRRVKAGDKPETVGTPKDAGRERRVQRRPGRACSPTSVFGCPPTTRKDAKRVGTRIIARGWSPWLKHGSGVFRALSRL